MMHEWQGIEHRHTPLAFDGDGTLIVATGPDGPATSALHRYDPVSKALGELMAAYQWWLLEPQTGSALVTTSLGSGMGRIYPALASDDSFAMVWTNGDNFTVNLAALAPSSVRAESRRP